MIFKAIIILKMLNIHLGSFLTVLCFTLMQKKIMHGRFLSVSLNYNSFIRIVPQHKI